MDHPVCSLPLRSERAETALGVSMGLKIGVRSVFSGCVYFFLVKKRQGMKYMGVEEGMSNKRA